MNTPRILCISLSPIERDARVLRQIGVLAELGEVTTVGYGSDPGLVSRHIEVPSTLPSLPQTIGGVVTLALRRWKRAEVMAPAIRFALDALDGERFDLVVANDARALGLAERLRGGSPLWADLHEWAPEERTHVMAWRVLVAPLMRYLCRTHLPRATVVSTVCESIADLYDEQFGVRPLVVRNSSAWQDLRPSSVDDDRIRLVHSGAAIHGRSLETMIDAVELLDDRFTLDLYLVPGGDGGAYLRALQDRAGGSTRVRFRDPVSPADLPKTLNEYDVGVFWIPPTHTNARYTLPNKFFDFVQARLAVSVGPSIEMQRLVHEYALGVVSEGFTAQECANSLRALTAQSVGSFKRASDEASRDLSFERDGEVMRKALAPLLSAR